MSSNSEIAAAAFEPMVAAAFAQRSYKALLLLADQAFCTGRGERAVEILEAILATDDIDPETRLRARDRLSKSVHSFHVEMIRDHPRNQAFEAALRRAVTAKTRVLDIGSGTGLLAMMAARAGARQVFSCEARPAMAHVARDNVRNNGFADRVTVIAKHSSEIDADADLGGPVDLVVAELIGRQLVDELVLPSMRDAVIRLVKPGGRVIPQSGDIRVALGWWDGLADRAMRTECGFDMTAFNRLLRPRKNLEVGDPELFLRGEEASLFSFNFSTTDSAPDRAELDLVSHGGPVNGVVQWLRLQMDAHGTYENRPAHGTASHWACCFFPLAQPIETQCGESVRVTASLAENRLYIWPS